MNTQKSAAFLYTNDEISEREIKKTIPFTTASKILNKFNQGGERPVCWKVQDVNETNWRRHK